MFFLEIFIKFKTNIKIEVVIMAIKITKENFGEEVLKSQKPVLVDFWAEWCGPCKMLSPIIDQIAEERPDIKVGKVNVDDEATLAGNFGIMGIPTLIYFKDGEIVQKSVGAVSKEKILSMLD